MVTLRFVHLPADHTEPRKSIVKWIASRDRFDIEVRRRWREFRLIMIHLAHQLQSLPGKQTKLYHLLLFPITRHYANAIVTRVLSVLLV